MQDSVLERVARVIGKLKSVPAEKISMETNLQELGVDSLDVVNIIFELEDEFHISIPDEFAEGIVTVRQVVERITKLLPDAATSTPPAQ